MALKLDPDMFERQQFGGYVGACAFVRRTGRSSALRWRRRTPAREI